VTVSGDAPRKNELMLKANEFVALGRRLGYRPDELAKIICNVTFAAR
jgi:hypothetical protein